MSVRLKAFDDDDVQVISCYAQDSIVNFRDIKFIPKERLLIIMLNRFKWENNNKNCRTKCLLKFENIDSVKSLGFKLSDLENGSNFLELLSILFVISEGGPGGYFELIFSGGGKIRAFAECIDINMIDVNDDWEVANRPNHNL